MLGRFDCAAAMLMLPTASSSAKWTEWRVTAPLFEKIAAQYIMTTNKSVYCPTK